jgi:hypothetical protein
MSTPKVAGEFNSGAYQSVLVNHLHGAQIKDQLKKTGHFGSTTENVVLINIQKVPVFFK